MTKAILTGEFRIAADWKDDANGRKSPVDSGGWATQWVSNNFNFEFHLNSTKENFKSQLIRI